MERRTFITLLAGGLLAAPLVGEAQQGGKVYRVGYLGSGPLSRTHPIWVGFLRGLREQGYVEGQNLVFLYRSAEGRNEAFPALAAELVRLKVDLIVAHAAPAVAAAKQATTTIPIVLVNVGDPVEAGLVASLAHPGGNVTGVSSQVPDFTSKLLELAKETVPGLEQVAAITEYPGNPGQAGLVKELERAASALGVRLHSFGVHEPADVQRAFTAIAHERPRALVVFAGHVTWFHRKQILALAARHRLPTVCMFRLWAEAGCLMGYGPSLAHMWYQAGSFAGKILKGAKPADLPIEQPTKFELVINGKTAKALGLTIPPLLLLRADELIQ